MTQFTSRGGRVSSLSITSLSAGVALAGLVGCATDVAPTHVPVTDENFHLVVSEATAFTIENFPYDPGESSNVPPTNQELSSLLSDFREVLGRFGLEENGNGAMLKLGVTYSIGKYVGAGVEVRAQLVLLAPSEKQKLYKGIRSGFRSESVVTYRGDLNTAIDRMLAKRRDLLIDDLPNHFCEFMLTVLPSRPVDCEEPKHRETNFNWEFPPDGVRQGVIPEHMLPANMREHSDR